MAIKDMIKSVTDSLPFFSHERRVQRAFSNESTGAGTQSDVLETLRINTHRRMVRPYLEALYANFWAAGKVVDMKPNDVFGPGIVWKEDDDPTERIVEEFERMDVLNRTQQAVIAGRIFGSAVLIFAPKNKDFELPLDIENVRQGEISHLLVADRYQLEELVLYGDPRHPKFGKAEKYRWNFTQVQGQPTEGQTRPVYPYIDIHASRCIRFDGIAPPTDDGWINAGEERWGISVLQRALDDILQDSVLSASLIDIVKRACVPVIKKQGWTEVLSRGGQTFKGEVSPEQAVQDISSNISNAKLMVIDKEDEVDKLEVETGGVNDIARSITERIAMVEGVPISRFTGESASGLSATGEGDARDWRITIDAYRRKNIDTQWKMIVKIVSQNIGLQDVPDWEWGQLGDATLEDKSTTTKTLAESVNNLVVNGIIDEEEARAILNNSELVDLDESLIPEMPAMQQAKIAQINKPQEKVTPSQRMG